MVNPPSELDVAGVPFQSTTLDAATRWLVTRAGDPDARPHAVRLANAYCVALASQQPAYGRLLGGMGVNFPDGAPVVAAMNMLHPGSHSERVRGPSFFRSVLEAGSATGLRHYFLGSTPETLQALEAAVHDAFPDAIIAGSSSPPFAAVDDAYLDALVEEAAGWDADVVWVGMGTPKQDFVAQALAERAGVFAVGVGAAFDFAAGTVREAPKWIQNSGFEWLFRLLTDPRRLWHRYVFGNTRFVLLVLRQALRRRARVRRTSKLAR